MNIEIPVWIHDIYKKVDKDGNGIITREELDKLDRQKEGVGTAYIFEEGMTLESFVNRNRSIFNGFITFEGDPVSGRQVLNEDMELQQTVNLRKTSLDSKESIEVAQGEYTIAKFSEDSKYMQTYGLGPCVGVTIYDKKNKVGFMAHIDTPSKAKSLLKAINKFKTGGTDFSECETRIIGGQTGVSMETVKIIKQIIEQENLPLYEMDVFGHTVRAIQLNLENGEVTDYKETIHTREDIDSVAIKTMTTKELTEHKFGI